jgi:glycosyltransferase involved in cell wall biosynthesis
MACGVPVVATRVGGNVELVQEGVTGLLVPAESPENVARALAGLLSDPARRRRLGQGGRLRANTEFSLNGMIRRYEGVYMDVVRRRNGHPQSVASWARSAAAPLSLGRHR